MSTATMWQIREQWGANVAHIAEIGNATSIREIGDGSYDQERKDFTHCTFFDMLRQDGSLVCRGATCSEGPPVWEDEDAEVFANLAEACGVAL